MEVWLKILFHQSHHAIRLTVNSDSACEAMLNMFPDNHTVGVSDIRRAFLMGNALVTGIIEKIGASLLNEAV